ncbi:MAG: hypothetical protein QOI61_481 [Actinomycetota bacterium]
MDAFDSDVLIYAADDTIPLGAPVLSLFTGSEIVGVGSLLLLVETLPRPLRRDSPAEVEAIRHLLGRLDLLPLDTDIADVAVDVAQRFNLKAPDGIHLATALVAGADRFITNNRRDFESVRIDEIDVVFPDQL